MPRKLIASLILLLILITPVYATEINEIESEELENESTTFEMYAKEDIFAYEQPDLNSNMPFRISKNSRLPIITQENGFYKLLVNGEYVYIKEDDATYDFNIYEDLSGRMVHSAEHCYCIPLTHVTSVLSFSEGDKISKFYMDNNMDNDYVVVNNPEKIELYGYVLRNAQKTDTFKIYVSSDGIKNDYVLLITDYQETPFDLTEYDLSFSVDKKKISFVGKDQKLPFKVQLGVAAEEGKTTIFAQGDDRLETQLFEDMEIATLNDLSDVTIGKEKIEEKDNKISGQSDSIYENIIMVLPYIIIGSLGLAVTWIIVLICKAAKSVSKEKKKDE